MQPRTESGAQPAIPGDVCLAGQLETGRSSCRGWRCEPLTVVAACGVEIRFDTVVTGLRAIALWAGWNMRRRCSSGSTIERYLGYFRKLLEAMVADESQAVDAFAYAAAKRSGSSVAV